MAKAHDLAVKIGEHNGKGIWENVGCVLSTDNGEIMLLKRTFNPAGVPNPDGKDSIIISKFPVREKGEGRADNQTPSRQVEDGDIPF